MNVEIGMRPMLHTGPVNADRVLARFVADVDSADLAAHGVSVRIADDQVGHRWTEDEPENIYSVSKGVCALAVGIAIDQGILSLETTTEQTLRDMDFGEGSGDITIEQLLSMRSGVDFEWFGGDPAPWADLAQEMLRRPRREPDSLFQYSDASTYVAMRMLAARVGDVRDWLVPHLFEPLGIPTPRWQRCPNGWILGGSGLELRTDELARIGHLLRDEGTWKHARLVSPHWVRRMHHPWRSTGGASPFSHYGLAAWRGPGTLWRLDGAFGQYVLIDQSSDAVITITAHEERRDHRLAELAVAALRA